jgi:hypothetical protein
VEFSLQIFCFYEYNYYRMLLLNILRGCQGRDRMVVGFTTTYAINAYHH